MFLLYYLDAFYPHLGANFEVGGKVVNDCGHECIRCPFHGWTFRGRDGMCQKVPQLETIDSNSGCQIPNARKKVWENIEINGFVHVWNDADGQKPDWYPLKIQEIQDSKCVYIRRAELTVYGCFQDMIENSADLCHFNEIHGPLIKDILQCKPSFYEYFYELINKMVYLELNSQWKSELHMSSTLIKMRILLFGYPLIVMNETIKLDGPAIIFAKLITPLSGTTFFYFGVVPVEPKKHRIIIQVYTEPTFMARCVSQLIFSEVLTMIIRNIHILNNKKFLKNPILIKGDKTIKKFRR